MIKIHDLLTQEIEQKNYFKKLCLHSVTDALVHQLQLCIVEDCCFAAMVKIIEDALILELKDILLLLLKLLSKH